MTDKERQLEEIIDKREEWDYSWLDNPHPLQHLSTDELNEVRRGPLIHSNEIMHDPRDFHHPVTGDPPVGCWAIICGALLVLAVVVGMVMNL